MLVLTLTHHKGSIPKWHIRPMLNLHGAVYKPIWIIYQVGGNDAAAHFTCAVNDPTEGWIKADSNTANKIDGVNIEYSKQAVMVGYQRVAGNVAPVCPHLHATAAYLQHCVTEVVSSHTTPPRSQPTSVPYITPQGANEELATTSSAVHDDQESGISSEEELFEPSQETPQFTTMYDRIHARHTATPPPSSSVPSVSPRLMRMGTGDSDYRRMSNGQVGRSQRKGRSSWVRSGLPR